MVWLVSGMCVLKIKVPNLFINNGKDGKIKGAKRKDKAYDTAR